MEFDFRPVLKFKGKSLMGTGRATLLREIRETDSLATAARRMGMSYRHAWGMIQHMEEIYGEKIVKSERGGAEGGQTSLTEVGERLLAEFENKYKMLSSAYQRYFTKPSLATDGILVIDEKIVLVQRKHEPFKEGYALPGGFVEYGEKLEECVIREFREETGLNCRVERLLGVYSDPDRDPRSHVVSAVYLLSLEGGKLTDSDETSVKLFPFEKLPPLAFDHEKIISDYLNSLKPRRRG